MAIVNSNYDKLVAGYLFPEIAKRTRAFREANPGVEVTRLGIGDTTEPLTPSVCDGMGNAVKRLGKKETYKGYGDEQGEEELRKAIANYYRRRWVGLSISEVFVSDGAKPDVANLQSLFGLENVVAVQDPAYPVYVDTNVIAGRTGEFDREAGRYKGLVYMPCTEENGFFPELPEMKVDLIYICSPNNPTGAVATNEQLEEFVGYARKSRAVIIFDAAYAPFISDDKLPRTIYEVDGAEECAIEVGSFSKIAGFTGVRLGWTVVPEDLVAENAEPGKLNAMWNRRQCTFFNGASNIAQAGGLTALTEQGQRECQGLADYYMGNARMIKEGVKSIGLVAYGGENAPYIWMKTPNGMKSWDFFDKLLNEAHVVGTPGAGFGPSGEGYLRLSAFGHRENIEKAVEGITKNLRL